MKTRVVLSLDVFHDLLHYSKVYTGLALLAERGLIDLRVRIAADYSPLLFLEVAAPGGAALRRVALDLSDQSTVFFAEGFDHCDLYFKRSFHRPDLERLPPDHRERVVGLGLNHPCSTFSATRWIVRHWLGGTAGRFLRSPRQVLGRALWMARRLRDLTAQTDYRVMEQPPETPAEPMILFQTRVWEPEESSEDLHQINEERVDLIRSLRKAFGPRFRGGVVPTPFARKHYPDVLLTESYRRTDFIHLLKRHLIGVYTRGLHHSHAFKLAEYLAGSLCMVSDPIRNELPDPLTPGRHFLEFRDGGECAARCERLLSHPEEARQMREHNAEYYRKWVAPAAFVRAFLERTTGAPLEGGTPVLVGTP